MIKIRRSCNRLIFNMGIPIPGKDGLYVETGPVRLRPFCYTACRQDLKALAILAELCFLGYTNA